ncbi:sucrose-6-phosphate hydrolase [Agarivorans albus]
MATINTSAKPSAHSDPWRPNYHLTASQGLINDPNGFSFHNGRFQLFYQWNPFGCDHKNKHWGHFSSSDLVHWDSHQVALAPGDWFDKDGCYSGTAAIEDESLCLYYTGNVREGERRLSYQCKAVQQADGSFKKLGPLNLPKLNGYTGHVRDPKLLRWQDQTWIILGAQTTNLEGGICLLQKQQEQWVKKGFISKDISLGKAQTAYMWECPDLFELDQQWLLLACPQGVSVEQAEYTNQNLSGYFCADMQQGPAHFKITSEFQLLDHGFEFYAPQVLQHQGESTLIAWLGLPDNFAHPTVDYQWTQILSMPRRLSWKDGVLQQLPAEQLTTLMHAPQLTQYIAGKHQLEHLSNSCVIDLELSSVSKLQLLIANGDDNLNIQWLNNELQIDRTNLGPKGADTLRRYQPRDGSLRQLLLFIDHSSFELFVNHGETVMSGRIFPNEAWNRVQFNLFDGQATLQTSQMLSSDDKEGNDE